MNRLPPSFQYMELQLTAHNERTNFAESSLESTKKDLDSTMQELGNMKM
jgi:hypothetical protein